MSKKTSKTGNRRTTKTEKEDIRKDGENPAFDPKSESEKEDEQKKDSGKKIESWVDKDDEHDENSRDYIEEEDLSYMFASEEGEYEVLLPVNTSMEDLIRDIVEKERCKKHSKKQIKNKLISMIIPTDTLKEHLDKHVVGNETAKKMLSVAANMHQWQIAEYIFNLAFKKREYTDRYRGTQKSSVLLVGPTGCGKTHMVKTISQILNVPFVSVDTSTLTGAGYKGFHMDDIFSQLIDKSSGDVYKAGTGIVFFDEIDKVISTHEDAYNFKLLVQQSLLKVIDGDGEEFTVKTGNGEGTQTIHTRNMLFIFGGVFPGLEKIIQRRKDREKRKNVNIGFSADVAPTEEVDAEASGAGYETPILPQDLVDFGFLAELVGRISMIAPVDPLDENALSRVLVEPENSLLNQIKLTFKNNGIDFEMSPEAIAYIVRQAKKLNVGARGLKSVCDQLMLDAFFEAGRARSEKLKKISLAMEGNRPRVLGNSGDKEILLA